MAGTQIAIDDAQLRRRIAAIQAGLDDATPLMRVWGEIAQTSVAENFERGGRPKWPPLSPVTVALKGHNRPLIGKTGNLRRIAVRPERSRVVLGTHPSARDYAAIQQKGGDAGRNRRVRIPARPYLVLQDEDRAEMRETARRYLQRLGGQA